MFLPGRGGKRRTVLLLAAGAVLLVGIASLCYAMLGTAHVNGATPQARIQSIGGLADGGGRGAADAIARAVGDPDASVRAAAVAGLGRFLRPRDRDLIEGTTQDPDPDVRAKAAVVLGRYADERAAERLARVLSGDDSDAVRAGAARALGGCGGSSAIVPLVRAMERDVSPAVRSAAFLGLLAAVRLGYDKVPDPQDAAAWNRATAVVLELPRVKSALAAAASAGESRQEP